jgi:hypothetical protein
VVGREAVLGDGNGGYARARTKREARVDVNNAVSPATTIRSRDGHETKAGPSSGSGLSCATACGSAD